LNRIAHLLAESLADSESKVLREIARNGCARDSDVVERLISLRLILATHIPNSFTITLLGAEVTHLMREQPTKQIVAASMTEPPRSFEASDLGN
jgi:hypothetical protein